MEWEEISRRLRNGTSVQVLADLAGCTYKTMYNRIRQHEQKDGRQYIKPEQMKRPHEMRTRKAEAVPEVPTDPVQVDVYNCTNCKSKTQALESLKPYCKKGHEYDENSVCLEYEKAPDFLEKKLNIPEKESEYKREQKKAAAAVCTADIRDTIPEEKPALEFKTSVYPLPDPEEAGLCQEVIDTLTENYKMCLQLAHSYARQANDYKCLLKRYCITVPERQKALLAAIPEVFKK